VPVVHVSVQEVPKENKAQQYLAARDGGEQENRGRQRAEEHLCGREKVVADAATGASQAQSTPLLMPSMYGPAIDERKVLLRAAEKFRFEVDQKAC
jgi:hypothetical protein